MSMKTVSYNNTLCEIFFFRKVTMQKLIYVRYTFFCMHIEHPPPTKVILGDSLESLIKIN